MLHSSAIVSCLWFLVIVGISSAEVFETPDEVAETRLGVKTDFAKHVMEISDLLHMFISLINKADETEGRELGLPEITTTDPVKLETASVEELFDRFETAAQSFRTRFLKYLKTTENPDLSVTPTISTIVKISQGEDLTKYVYEHENIGPDATDSNSKPDNEYDALTVDSDVSDSEKSTLSFILSDEGVSDSEMETDYSTSTEVTDVRVSDSPSAETSVAFILSNEEGTDSELETGHHDSIIVPDDTDSSGEESLEFILSNEDQETDESSLTSQETYDKDLTLAFVPITEENAESFDGTTFESFLNGNFETPKLYVAETAFDSDKSTLNGKQKFTPTSDKFLNGAATFIFQPTSKESEIRTEAFPATYSTEEVTLTTTDLPEDYTLVSFSATEDGFDEETMGHLSIPEDDSSEETMNILSTTEDDDSSEKSMGTLSTTEDDDSSEETIVNINTTEGDDSSEETTGILSTTEDDDSSEETMGILSTTEDDDSSEETMDILSTTEDDDSSEETVGILSTTEDDDSSEETMDILSTTEDDDSSEETIVNINMTEDDDSSEETMGILSTTEDDDSSEETIINNNTPVDGDSSEETMGILSTTEDDSSIEEITEFVKILREAAEKYDTEESVESSKEIGTVELSDDESFHELEHFENSARSITNAPDASIEHVIAAILSKSEQKVANEPVSLKSSDSELNSEDARSQENISERKRLVRTTPVYSQMDSVIGLPGEDYPNYTTIVSTSFTCEGKERPGLYADLETRCQVFHACLPQRRESYLCPVGSTFNQPILSCDYWFNSTCSLSQDNYHVNNRLRNYPPQDDELLEYLEDNVVYPYDFRFEHSHPIFNGMKFLPFLYKINNYSSRRRGLESGAEIDYDKAVEIEFDKNSTLLTLEDLDQQDTTTDMIDSVKDRFRELLRSFVASEDSEDEVSSDEDSLLQERKSAHEKMVRPRIKRSGALSEEKIKENLDEETTIKPSSDQLKPLKPDEKQDVLYKGKHSKAGKEQIAPAIVFKALETAESVINKGILPITRELLAANYVKLYKRKKL